MWFEIVSRGLLRVRAIGEVEEGGPPGGGREREGEERGGGRVVKRSIGSREVEWLEDDCGVMWSGGECIVGCGGG